MGDLPRMALSRFHPRLTISLWHRVPVLAQETGKFKLCVYGAAFLFFALIFTYM